MANSNFVVKNGLTVGALTIDASTGNITTSGTISGDLATSSIAKNDTSLALNDTGTGSDVAVTVDPSKSAPDQASSSSSSRSATSTMDES